MLQGTLNDFTLADVFSLLALTKKTGALRVTSDGTDGRIFFRKGMICLALSDAKRVPLGARLVSAGLVDEQQVRSTIEQHPGDSVAITEALLASGQVEDRILTVFLREQIVDAVFELMRLTEGSFNFDIDAPALSRGVGLSVADVVGEANRRLDEWQSLHQRIASPDAVLAMVPSAANGREGVILPPEQWELLALIDGRRTVADVVELTGRGEFATCRVLGELVHGGLVQAQDPADGGQTDLAKLIAAREALRSLEHVDKGGIRPLLSSAAPLSDGVSRVRWVEPPSETPAVAAARPGVLPSRSRIEPATAAVPSATNPQTKTEEAPATKVEAKAQPTPVAASNDAAPTAGSKESPTETGNGSTPPDAEDTPKTAPAKVTVEAPGDLAVTAPHAVDRAQVARELASLGADDAGPSMAGLTRDSDLNKGLLLRLIDGVKGA